MNARIRILAEGSMMIALATVLSMLKVIELPYGGSVTLASALPIALIGYRHGSLHGLFAGLVFGAIQLLLGLNTLSYFTTPVSIVAVIALDYLLAFAVLGLGGMFRRTVRSSTGALILGALLVSLLRFVCHTVAGATVWAGLSIPDEAALLYSLSYNATYMLPETIILVAVCLYLSQAIDFTRRIPAPRPTRGAETLRLRAYTRAALPVALGVIADTLLIFPHLQDPDSGALDLSRLAGVSWLSVVAVTLGTLVAASLAFHLTLRRRRGDTGAGDGTGA